MSAGAGLKFSRALRLACTLHNSWAPLCERIDVVGSVARQKTWVSDIELVCVPRWEWADAPVATTAVRSLFEDATETGTPKVRVNALHRALADSGEIRWVKPATSEIVDWPIREDGKYWRGILTGDVHLDVFIATPENFGLIQVIRTGCADFSRALVTHAKQVGKPSVKGFLMRDGEPVNTPHECDVFRELGLQWVAPWKRDSEKALQVLAGEK